MKLSELIKSIEELKETIESNGLNIYDAEIISFDGTELNIDFYFIKSDYKKYNDKIINIILNSVPY